ncbi:TPA: hypothetical protein I3313_004973 [Enterobacter hormaechei subsp. hoffmannii]|uniref:hypothetical protein n=1 Tax=Enterobacter TaxID=547 RepID=UPI000792FEC4|nr:MULTISPECIES: hypothetical protein [Enterobacter]MCA2404489.1 hypothetical protein [Enterobacter sp. CCUG 70166]CZZ29758.1 Uncharacterised protein [Enterobacter hormaechei]HAS0829918.1 hypothetical protein [Enterobacter hormaechei subsp. hoffmannii]HAT7667444.1 hypothetical protein [Enterobacter hormaechei subsp. hoffmannii]
MSVFLFSDIPDYHTSKFVSVRDTFDNLTNLLLVVEIINLCGHCRTVNHNDFDFAVYSGAYARILVKKSDGFFTMSLPFKVIDYGGNVVFNYEDYNKVVNAEFISMMRNAIGACRDYGYSHEEVIFSLTENFNLEYREAANYCDIFTSLITDDHGYFRFDDDPDNENGRIHPRYHFDLFYKNSTTIKIGVSQNITAPYFLNLFDKSVSKYYLV